MGEGTWKRTPTQRQAPIAASITNVRRWGHALFTEPTPLESFRSLTMPVLCMVGARSTPAALGVARLLTATLPRVEVMTFEQLGHMGPVTHSDAVNAAIEQFLARHG
jgi:pimeloyl-ACP methyl ester carboxylesterase